uniref:Synaptobrevin, longin-like domain protein n=1 Tax=Tanacetum cinerariifolium TaxID=118510 RepID=A0A6L2M8Q5_TANCI|nr:hypothetical protein [Tanacetum cinerariifolium]
MAHLTFADTHNMVAFLSKSNASAGFDQIMDFLAANTIQDALVVNDVVRLHALIDEKKVVVTKDAIRRDLCLDDADGVECLPNEEIFAELARMGYEKPPPKSKFYKAFFSTQWKFLIYTLFQCVSAKRTVWNEFSYSMASALLQAQPSLPHESSLSFLNTMMKTCATLSNKVAELEQDKHTQALEILKLKKRVKKLENKRRSKHSGLKRLGKVGGKIKAIDADEDITLVDVKTQVD